MAITKEPRAEKITSNYADNTVKVTINGKECLVNKFEVQALKDKMKKSKKFE